MKKVKALMKANSTDEKSAREFLDSIDLVLKAKKEKKLKKRLLLRRQRLLRLLK